MWSFLNDILVLLCRWVWSNQEKIRVVVFSLQGVVSTDQG